MLSTLSTSNLVTIELEKSCLASISMATQFKHSSFVGCMNVISMIRGHRDKINFIYYMFKCLVLFCSSQQHGKTNYLTNLLISLIKLIRAEVNPELLFKQTHFIKNFSEKKQYNYEE